MNILITGASGYLGSQLFNSLSLKYNVVGVVRSTSSTERINEKYGVLVSADDSVELESAFYKYKPEVVINTVALYGRNGESLSELIKSNILYPSELVALSKNYGTKALIHTGTSLPSDVSDYALTKNMFMRLINQKQLSGVKLINVALEHFYGPGEDTTKFISYVLKECLHGYDLNLTLGTQERDFIYIDDVISAYDVIISKIEQLKEIETISLGTGDANTIRSVVESIHRLSHSTSKLKFGVKSMRDKEVMYSCADITKMKTLGWDCKFSLNDGLEKVIKFGTL